MMMSVRETAASLGIVVPSPIRGRHDASRPTVHGLTVGALRVIHGLPARVTASGQYVAGRHAAHEDTTEIVLPLF